MMHTCPGRGCYRQIGSNELACTRCYRKLPARLRNTIKTSYRHDDPVTHTPAVTSAVEWLNSTSTAYESPVYSYDGGSGAASYTDSSSSCGGGGSD